MKIVIVYATTEGQTRKIARFAADRLSDAAHVIELVPAAEAGELDLSRFEKAILAGSVHVGKYQADLAEFAQRNADALNAMPTLFLSVSLAAAGDDPDDWKGLADCVARFTKQTGWSPGRVEHVAGAFRFTQYDFFRSWAMRWIAAQKGETVDPREDKEYTDWAKLEATLHDWVAG